MKTLFLFIAMIVSSVSYSQKQSSSNAIDKNIRMSDDLSTPAQVNFDQNDRRNSMESIDAISSVFNIKKDELVLKNSTSLTPIIIVERYIRYIDEIKVPHGNYTVLINNNKIESIHAEHYNSKLINKNKLLSEQEALDYILPTLGSTLYGWESTEELLSKYAPESSQYRKLQEVLVNEYPSGELVFVKDYYGESQNLELAYLFTIESVIPEFRDRVYVSASDARILLRDPQLKHGSGDTRYSGNRSFPTNEIMGPPGALYELKGNEAISNVLCETRSLEGLGGLPISSPAIVALSDSIVDGDELDPCLTDTNETIAEFGDDVWNSNEHRKVPFDGTLHTCCPTYISEQCDEVRNDDIALDAHWGAATVARYWKDIHDRYGYDDDGAPLYSYVHHGLSHENASWNGMIMKYGDGAYQDGTNPGGMFGPLVSLDVCAHEIGHAICTSTSDLVYVGESGAMNEGLSDIWAAATESYVLDSIDGTLDYVTWAIGEQIDERDGGLFDEPGARAIRWMDHPPAENNPDTYGAGTWWQDPDCASPSVANDFCGVHFNSGVLNKWFYLLTEGSGQAMSPGLNKPAFDDEINDKNDTYSVTGIGFRKSEKIIFGANLLLSPNSKFIDMRAASIDVARSLYGPCSNEVEQTIRAWYGVGVGPDFGSCLATVEFNQFNMSSMIETSMDPSCAAATEINLSVFSYMSSATINITTSGNAIEGEDYELCFNTLTFNGTEEKSIKILVNDDKIIESTDTIIINITGGGFSDSDTILIFDDDGIPAIGGLDTLLAEDFSTNDNSWQQELVNPASLLNEWFIDAFDTNEAHISYNPSSNVPTYSQVVESHVRLKSPQINAIGRKNVAVNFTYSVGGERDLVDPEAIFDFGTFEVSYDGFEWEEIELFVGEANSGGTIIVSDTFSMMLPQLDNSNFYLGYTWYNDALNGSAYSFMFDNVIVSGEGLEIESEIGDSMEADVPEGQMVGFISENDNEVIAIVQDAGDDLGCTSIEISDNDTNVDQVTSICKLRGTKVFNIATENVTDSIQIKLFFKESEIDDWTDFNTLNILGVHNDNIDIESTGVTIIANADIVIEDETDGGDGYVTYSFWMHSDVKSLALTDRSDIPQTHWVSNVTDSDPSSFRDLVTLACPEDTIRFLNIVDNNQITLTTGTINFDKNLHIRGNGIDITQIYSNNTTFNIMPNVELSLSKISIKALSPIPAVINNGEIKVLDSVEVGY